MLFNIVLYQLYAVALGNTNIWPTMFGRCTWQMYVIEKQVTIAGSASLYPRLFCCCDITPLLGFYTNKKEREVLEIGLDSDPYSTFLFAMRSPQTKEKVIGRLRMFFDFIGIPEDQLQARCRFFANKGKDDQAWVFSCTVRYLQSLKERFDRKDNSH